MTQITATLTEGMVVTLSNGRHEWSADEPLTHGVHIKDNATITTGTNP